MQGQIYFRQTQYDPIDNYLFLPSSWEWYLFRGNGKLQDKKKVMNNQDVKLTSTSRNHLKNIISFD